MDDDNHNKETFEAFKESFFYGKRSNLNFKFIAELSDEDAGSFFEALLNNLTDRMNDGNIQELYNFIVEQQEYAYVNQKNFEYEDGPFTTLEKPVSASRVALMTSSGHFVDGDDPNPLGVTDMTQKEAEERVLEFIKEAPVLSEIPFDTDRKQLRVRHGGYDVSAAMIDEEVNFPYLAVQGLLKSHKIGSLPKSAYSFNGACAQTRLLKKNGPEWVNMLKDQHVEAAILVPV